MKISHAKPTSRTVLGLGVIALLLVLASTGGAVAGAMITGKQVKDGTITTKDVKDKSLKLNDLAAATVTGLKGRTGPVGPAGPAGADGPAGTSDVTIRSKTVSADWLLSFQTFCHADERAISAGVRTATTGDAVAVLSNNSPLNSDYSHLDDGDTLGLGGGYWAEVRNLGSGGTIIATLYVSCAKN